MKRLFCLLGIIFGVALSNAGQPVDRSIATNSFDIIARGPDHDVVQYFTSRTNDNGKVVRNAHQYTVLATGLNVEDKNGAYTPASPAIEIRENKAVADKARHKVTFSANIADVHGSIELSMPDSKKLRSRPLCISYYDPTTGESIMIAEVKDAIGQVDGANNRVIYPDCFTDFKCDLVYDNRLSGMEQNLILREQPPAPSEFGMNNATTRLQLLTELFDPPVPKKHTEKRNRVVSDAVLDFGAMHMGKGKAFSAVNAARSRKLLPVDKHWQNLEGRDFLIEEIEYKTFVSEIQKLPARPVAVTKVSKKQVASTKRVLPRIAANEDRSKTGMRVAQAPSPSDGFVLDYSIASSLSDFTFRGDVTYFVTNNVTLDGTTTIEGGTVVKYATNSMVLIEGDIRCLTEPYRPAVFTAKDDDSVGEKISGSTGLPVGYYATDALAILPVRVHGSDIQYVRVAYANVAIACDEFPNSEGPKISHSQIVNCNTALTALNMTNSVVNTLIYHVNTGFSLLNNTIKAEHLTIHECNTLGWSEVDDGRYRFTNCLFSCVANLLTAELGELDPGNLALVSSETNAPSNSFQVVGAGAHYLAENSSYRNYGTTNISPSLLVDLRQKTTYPPTLLSNVTFSTDTILAPTAQRDTDAPDLGYHYDPIDYLAHVYISNCVVTLTNGVRVGGFGGVGLYMLSGNGQLFSEGTVLNRNHIFPYWAAQELPVTLPGRWGTIQNWSSTLIQPPMYSPYPSARLSFTDFDSMASGGVPINADDGWAFSSLSISDCNFKNGGTFELSGPVNSVIGITNSLFQRIGLNCFHYASINVCNCHFESSALFIWRDAPAGPFVFKDNVFNRCDVQGYDLIPIGNDYNVYINSTGGFITPGANETNLASFTFTNGPLGNFYQVSTNLLNRGSQTADLAGLYHYTTRTNQVKETNSMVDIGLHYVALDNNGNPIDSDGDGLADYFEDSNGNGVVDGRETNWQNSDTDGDGVSDYLEWLQGRNPLAGAVPDSGNLTRLRVFTPLK